jgi:hypothetical protein
MTGEDEESFVRLETCPADREEMRLMAVALPLCELHCSFRCNVC